MFESQLFERILIETKVNAIRRHSPEEAEAVVDAIKSSIKKYKFKIAQRDKNLDFMHIEHINEETSKIIIERYLQPRNLVAVLPNRNDQNEELYLFSVCVPITETIRKFIYLKVAITQDGRVTAISWHKQNEKMQVDYRRAEEPDSRFLHKLGKVWMKLYNNIVESPKIINSYYDGDCIFFNFDKVVCDSDEDVINNVCRSVPKDFGYRYKDIAHNISFEHGDMKIYCPFGHF